MTRKHRIIQLALIVSFLLLITACSDKKENTVDATEEKKESEKIEISFPYAIDDDRLLVTSLFQSSIENPDCGNKYADDIASIEITNQSGKYLESAEITLQMDDGTEIHMFVEDVPTNQKVWAFDNQNQSIANDVTCVSIMCESNYLDEIPLMENQIAVDVNETTVTLLNQSEETLSGLMVECHCLFDGVYYGGLAYNYPVDELSPNSTVVIEADDCFLGTADVVRIIK